MVRLLYEKNNDLPVGFTEVEYLQSTGAQYIDTGIVGKNTLRTEITLQELQIAKGTAVFGTFDSDSSHVYYLYQQGSPDASFQPPWQVGMGDFENTSTLVDLNKHTFILDNNEVYLDGNLLSTFSQQEFTTTRTLLLFNMHKADNTLYTAAPQRLYSCKMIDNGTVVRDFIPILDSNRIPCLYDRVTRTNYYNQGTGSFTVGREIHPVEYIESSGTQYIDTGYYPNQDMKVECKLYNPIDFNTSKPGSILFGARTGSSSTDYTYTVISNILNKYGMRWDYGLAANNISLLDYPLTVGEHIIVKDKQYNYLDGTLVATNQSDTFSINYPMHIFGANSAGTNTLPFIGRYYYFKIYNNNLLVRDYIPAIDENGVAFMFDRVNHSAYLNSGTGSFTYGKKIPPRRVRILQDTRTKNSIPNFLTEVEYIASNGNQYINTGFVPTVNTKTVLSIDYTWTNTAYLFGVTSNDYRTNVYSFSGNHQSGDTGYFRMFVAGDTSISSQQGNAGTSSVYTSSNLKSIEFTNTYCTLDGTLFNYVYPTTEPLNITGPMFLFARNNNGTADNNSIMKLYKCQIYDNNILVRDFVPVLDGDNVPCLYDRVTRTLYYNAGTGNFTYGKEIHPVEYIGSDGNQYINSLVVPNNNTKVEYDFEPLEWESDKFMFGQWGNSSTHGRMCIYIQAASAQTPKYYQYGFGTGSGVENTNFKNFTIPEPLARHYVIIDNSSCTIDGTVYASGMTGSMANNTATFWIGKCNDLNGRATNPTKIYGCKIFNNGVLIHDYIPAVDENNTGFMIDKVTHVAHTNQGTGNFTHGDLVFLDRVRILEDSHRELPSEFVEVEYLESTGTQYINTEINASSDLGFDITYALTTPNDQVTTRFGAIKQDDSGSATVYLRHHMTLSSAQSNSRIQYMLPAYTKDLSKDTDIHNLKLDTVNKTFTYDYETPSSYTQADFNCRLSYYLFGRNDYLSGAYSITYAKMKVYRARLYSSGTLVRDYIPCIDNVGVACLYDKVSKRAFYNKGTGVFNVGRQIKPIQYLESTGTQYIDTGLKGDLNTAVNIKYKFPSASTASGSGRVFGSRESSVLNALGIGTYSGTVENGTQLTLYFSNSNTGSQTIATVTVGGWYYSILSKDELSTNGVQETLPSTATTFITPNNLKLFGFDNNGTMGYGRVQIASTKIYSNGVVMRDYIAAKDENNVGFMFDKENHIIYDNAGTGSFSYRV